MRISWPAASRCVANECLSVCGGAGLAKPVALAVCAPRGALLTDYERRLGERFPQFLERYRERAVAALGDARPLFYTYKRVLIWGRF